MAKESLKLAPSEGEQKPPPKERFEGGDKCVYPSEVSVMELKKKKKGPKSHIRTYTQSDLGQERENYYIYHYIIKF